MLQDAPVPRITCPFTSKKEEARPIRNFKITKGTGKCTKLVCRPTQSLGSTGSFNAIAMASLALKSIVGTLTKQTARETPIGTLRVILPAFAGAPVAMRFSRCLPLMLPLTSLLLLYFPSPLPLRPRAATDISCVIRLDNGRSSVSKIPATLPVAVSLKMSCMLHCDVPPVCSLPSKMAGAAVAPNSEKLHSSFSNEVDPSQAQHPSDQSPWAPRVTRAALAFCPPHENVRPITTWFRNLHCQVLSCVVRQITYPQTSPIVSSIPLFL